MQGLGRGQSGSCLLRPGAEPRKLRSGAEGPAVSVWRVLRGSACSSARLRMDSRVLSGSFVFRGVAVGSPKQKEGARGEGPRRAAAQHSASSARWPPRSPCHAQCILSETSPGVRNVGEPASGSRGGGARRSGWRAAASPPQPPKKKERKVKVGRKGP